MTGHPHQWFGGRTYSQHGEDLILLNIFKRLEIERPSYLDIGAHHPFDLSNTALLYASGSRGINVEPNPHLHQDFLEHRPEDINLMAAVVGEPSLFVDFFMASERSGINSTVRAAMAGHGIAETISVPAITVDRIVGRYWSGKYPDLISIDVEGRELEIVRSIDSDEPPKVFVVEAANGAGDISGALRHHFVDRGYMLFCWAGYNMIFVQEKFWSRLY